jgi:5-methylcytosine-specific restriction protein A
MFKILHDSIEIARAQGEFEARFRSAGKQMVVKVGHKGEIHEMEVSWMPAERIWAGSRKLTNRYWNAFGIGKPSPRNSNSIVCEINFPLHGVSRRIGGVLAKDDEGIIRVFHRGNIGGGRRGVGPQLFRNQFKGKWESVLGDDVILIGSISAPDFVGLVSQFVKEVSRIKPKS